MSQAERYGTRDLLYSGWHRAARISRFLPMPVASRLTYIDLDGIEVCGQCYEPLCLVETARDIGQSFKNTRIMVELAKRAQVRALLVFYKPDGDGDIASFRVRSVWPVGKEEQLSPYDFAWRLVELRERHASRCPRARGAAA